MLRILYGSIYGGRKSEDVCSIPTSLCFAATHSVLVLTQAELDLKNTKPVGVDVVFWEIISNSGTFGSK